MRLRTLINSSLLLAASAMAESDTLRLVLDEDFSRPTLDPTIWNIETGRRRDAMNSRESVDLRDGRLVITTWTNDQGVTLCGFVTTRGKLTIRSGKAVARCRHTVEPGTQIAFWAQSPTYGRSGKAAGAAEDGVEIDIMETTGLMGGEYQYALHWGPYHVPAEKRTSNRRFKGRIGGDWHDYGVEWDDAGYRFTLDGRVVATDTTCPPSRAPQFLLLTSESNAKGWSGERPATGYGAKASSRNVFEVDWVKAWTREPAGAATTR